MSDDTPTPARHPFFQEMRAGWPRELPPLIPAPPELIAVQDIHFIIESYRAEPRRLNDMDPTLKVERTATRHQLVESLPDVYALLRRTPRGDTLHYLTTNRLAQLTHAVTTSRPIDYHYIRAVNLAAAPFDPADSTRSLAALDVTLALLKWNARYVTLGSQYDGFYAVVCEKPGMDPANIDSAAQEYAFRNYPSSHTYVRHAY
ncbi:hypothetical protein [Deinococcus sp. UR1]|uniref:hypothetical protein n=1 Tax=Deinococcus sp. UR1 TaxID=1704277 RepID=UPI000C18868B|nr:hypothetical protein [Deinococcus sp. UR1]PIG96891.1 hypothetical protein AMD26_015295 [Deinococcus sp. UR1]